MKRILVKRVKKNLISFIMKSRFFFYKKKNNNNTLLIFRYWLDLIAFIIYIIKEALYRFNDQKSKFNLHISINSKNSNFLLIKKIN